MIGFFTCILHIDIGSNVAHEEDNSHHTSPTNKVACIDNQVSTRTTNNFYNDFISVIIPQNTNEIFKAILLNFASDHFVLIAKPPNDGIALYVKNSIYRL